MANENVRVDTTFIGYLLIGFILLLCGVMGLQDGGLFGRTIDPENYHNLPIDYSVFAQIVGAVGMILILLTVFAYRTGKAPAAGIFAFFGAAFIFYYLGATYYYDSAVANSNWFMYMAIAIFFLIFAIYALVSKAPKFVTVLVFLVALMFLFFSLACYFYLGAPGTGNPDTYKAVSIVYGIFGFLGFIVATYLGLAYANPKKIPLI